MQGKCARCHTLGRGRFVGPDLLDVGDRYSRDDLVKWAKNPESLYSERKKKPINDGYPPMPPMNLSEIDAQKVADYLLSYTPPPDLSENGMITGEVRNITMQKPQEGQDVVLISYMGDRPEDRHFAKSDSLGRFSFPSLRWDRSYEIMLFHEESSTFRERWFFFQERTKSLSISLSTTLQARMRTSPCCR